MHPQPQDRLPSYQFQYLLFWNTRRGYQSAVAMRPRPQDRRDYHLPVSKPTTAKTRAYNTTLLVLFQVTTYHTTNQVVCLHRHYTRSSIHQLIYFHKHDTTRGYNLLVTMLPPTHHEKWLPFISYYASSATTWGVVTASLTSWYASIDTLPGVVTTYHLSCLHCKCSSAVEFQRRSLPSHDRSGSPDSCTFCSKTRGQRVEGHLKVKWHLGGQASSV